MSGHGHRGKRSAHDSSTTRFPNGYFDYVVDDLEIRGLNPRRLCINTLAGYQSSSWPNKMEMGESNCAIYIPIYASQFSLVHSDAGAGHLAADGSVYLISAESVNYFV